MFPARKAKMTPGQVSAPGAGDIAPAIGNAIAHATGQRFRSLPITAADIEKALS